MPYSQHRAKMVRMPTNQKNAGRDSIDMAAALIAYPANLMPHNMRENA